MGAYGLFIGLLVTCSFSAVQSASILALFSSLSYSDHFVFRGYVSLLVQRGHSVVVMTPYPGFFTHPDTERIVELDVGQESTPYWTEFKNLASSEDYYSNLRLFNELAIKIAIAQLKSKQMTALFINPNIGFDLVITEADVPVLYAVAEKYKAPHIAITTSSGKIHQHEAKGNPVHPLLYPDVNTLNYRHNLSVWQEIQEVNRHVQTKLEYYNSYLPLSELAAKKILGLDRDLLEVEYDIDMLFVAGNPALIGNRPTVPAITYVDRMHIKPGFVLPQDLQTTLDNASKGVIYFSIGAVQDVEHLSRPILQTLADAFRELPYLVLWKIANTSAINKSENVLAQAWFPQQEILAHPNVKLFLTHGGPRSLEEAVYYKVPILGLPTVRSRKTFIKEVTKFGAGEILDLYNLEKEELKAKISSIAGNEEYKQSISKLNEMVFNELISGPNNAVWWTEYVIRHGGARHLRSQTVGVPFFQYYMLDVISFAVIGVLFAIFFSYLTLKYLIKSIRSRYSYNSRHEFGGKFKAL